MSEIDDAARDPLLGHGIVTTADYLGTAVFAAQGAFVAVRHGLDVFGVLVIAFVAALGGGIARDVLIGDTPVAALRDWRYPAIAFGAAAAVVGTRFAGAGWPADVVRLLDAAGLSLFAVAGARKAERLGLSPIVIVMLGVVTAVGGGVVRDLLLNTVPGVLRTDIYATAALAGASAMVAARRLGARVVVAALLGGLVCFALRLAAIAFLWRLPIIG